MKVQILGARVRQLRELRDLTQGQLAYKADTTAAQISRIENNERPGAQAVVRERRRRTTGPYQRREGNAYTGVAFCARCGHRMTRTQHGGHPVWRCLTQANPQRSERYPCHANNTAEWRITKAIRLWMLEYSTPERLDAMTEAIVAGQGNDELLRQEEERLDASLARLRRQRDNLADDRINRVIDVEMYHRKDTALMAQIDQGETRLEELRDQLEALPDAVAIRKQLEAVAWNFPALLVEAPPVELSRALQTIGIRVMCEECRVVEVLPRL